MGFSGKMTVGERGTSLFWRVAYFMSPVSLSQIIKIKGKYILLCNSFVLSFIEFIFAVEVP